MAVVYKAFDKRLESEVAFKLLRTEMLTVESQKTVLDRFEFEAKALAKLNHPNIVSVIDYGDYQGTPWLVMKYMEGGTVKQFIGNVVPPPEAARCWRDCQRSRVRPLQRYRTPRCKAL